MKNKENFPKETNEPNEKTDGYPKYPESEDIYNKFEEKIDIDPENVTKKKPLEIDLDPEWNEMDFDLEHPGADLDVPGAELDDEQEKIGSEDEENNYYSIGGDNHNDLEEDNQ
jgi:hypothetical protein